MISDTLPARSRAWCIVPVIAVVTLLMLLYMHSTAVQTVRMKHEMRALTGRLEADARSAATRNGFVLQQVVHPDHASEHAFDDIRPAPHVTLQGDALKYKLSSRTRPFGVVLFLDTNGKVFRVHFCTYK
jgi:hypothetical protein